ncbi:alpha/beta hydrolase [Thalassomonas sp. RHCl1]|uniref:alpha/beta hydrolase n=1 Tax=Thalassomonas sp. RHCl1 TaxID=2995320 RepID=UPI00248AF592|nr:alpha/beta hydrolase [Thalassomonas sp. RHCl1]
MIYVFSNRNIIKNNSWLGDGFNSEGNENIRVAKYISGSTKKLKFFEENESGILPSRQVINELEESDKPCCIFLHGFNQSLTKNMKKCEEIASYGVNVIAFSWPSNPGPQKWWWKLKEYKAARQNARRSTVALERFFDKFNDYMEETGSITNIQSMVVHSLGNYLLESFVSGRGYEGQTSFLKNILLHQADVDSKGHEIWADKISESSRVMATINETDDVLDFSDIINPDRLGNTLENLNSEVIKYFNFGRLDEADDKHRLWINPVTKTESVKSFFHSVFTGKKVKTGHLAFDYRRNCFHFE